MRRIILRFANVCVWAALLVSLPAFSVGPEVERATQLLKDSHADQCERQRLRGQILVAHQGHDQGQLDALSPQLEAVNQRLKSTEDQLKTLKAVIRKNSDDQNAFETVQLELGSCD